MNPDSVPISLADIDTIILRSARNVLDPGFTTGKRVIAHYQIQYIQDGCGIISIDREVYPVRKGMLCFWGPDMVHEISSDPKHPLVILGVQFHMIRSLQPVQFIDFKGYPHILTIHAQARAESLLLEIVKEYTGQRLYWEAFTGALFKALLLLLARQTNLSEGEPNTAWQTTEKILKYIEEHYMEVLTNEAIAKPFHFHPAHVNKLISKSTGLSLHQYLMNIRMNQAVEMLQSTSMSIQQIADAVGYSSIHYFSRTFKKKMGITATMARRQLKLKK